MEFTATVEPVGRAAGIEVPADIAAAMGPGKQPNVVITINGHSWASRVTSLGGRLIVGIGAGNRKACGIAEGDVVTVDLQPDAAPRVVDVPADLATALDDNPAARQAFDRLSYSHKRRYVVEIERAKSPETRQRRIEKTIAAVLAE